MNNKKSTIRILIIFSPFRWPRDLFKATDRINQHIIISCLSTQCNLRTSHPEHTNRMNANTLTGVNSFAAHRKAHEKNTNQTKRKQTGFNTKNHRASAACCCPLDGIEIVYFICNASRSDHMSNMAQSHTRRDEAN